MTARALQAAMPAVMALLPHGAMAQSAANDQSDAARYQQAQALSRSTKLFREPDFRRHQSDLCTGLLKSFRSGRNTTVVEPLFRTNDSKDPRFTKLQESCPAVPVLEAYDKNHNFYR